MTYDGSNIKLYVNGVLDTTTPKTGTLSGDGCAQIGRYNTGGCDNSPSSYFNGLIDEVRIYNYALTADQILMDYNQGAAIRFGPATGTP